MTLDSAIKRQPATLSATERDGSRTSRDAVTWTVDGAKLEKERILHGWTRRRLAERSHVDRSTLST